jgi:hypothetical protein
MPFWQANAGLGCGGGWVGFRMVTALRCRLGVFSVGDVEIFLVNVPPVTQRPSRKGLQSIQCHLFPVLCVSHFWGALKYFVTAIPFLDPRKT